MILERAMTKKRRVSCGDAKKMGLHVAVCSTFPSKTDHLISFEPGQRDLPNFLNDKKSLFLVDRGDSDVQRFDLNPSVG